MLLQVFVGKYEGTIVAIKLLLGVDSKALQRFQREVAMLAGKQPPPLLPHNIQAQWHQAVVVYVVHLGSLYRALGRIEHVYLVEGPT